MCTAQTPTTHIHTLKILNKGKSLTETHIHRESFALDEIIALDLLRRNSPLLKFHTHVHRAHVHTVTFIHYVGYRVCVCIQIEINTHQANKFETNKSNYVPTMRSSFILKFIAITSENL